MGSLYTVKRRRAHRAGQVGRTPPGQVARTQSLWTSSERIHGNANAIQGILRTPTSNETVQPTPGVVGSMPPQTLRQQQPLISISPNALGKTIQRKDLKRCRDKHYAQGNTYLHATMAAGEKGILDMVKRLVGNGSLKRNWRLMWYTEQVKKLNFESGRKY